MTGKAIGLSMGYGFAGTVSRTTDAIIKNKPVKSTSGNISFGAPVSLDSSNTWIDPVSTVISPTNFAGVAVAEVRQLGSYLASSDSSGGGYYAPLQPCDVIARGVVTVYCQNGTPVAGGSVYVRTVLNGSYPDAVVGGFEAASDSTNSILLTNAYWNTGLMDSNGMAELEITSINN